MTNKSPKISTLMLAAGGVAVGLLVVTYYQKSLIRRLRQAKNVILYDFAKIQRTDFNIEIVNDSNKCKEVIARLKE